MKIDCRLECFVTFWSPRQFYSMLYCSHLISRSF